MADLHATAVAAYSNLEKLATGLAQAQAPDNVVKTVSQMADVTKKVVTSLGKGQEQTGDKQPPAQEVPAEQPPAQEQQPGRPHTLDSATAALHNDAQAAAKQRGAGY